MNRIVEIKVLDNYSIWIKFADGVSKTIDFTPFIGQGLSKDLLDKNYFRQVSIESGGGLEWPNGYDFCPNFLKDFASSGKKEMA
jgi:uncharacterized protein DUF2442